MQGKVGTKVKDILGILWFEPEQKQDGSVESKYIGVVTGIVVRKDDGSEVEVRAEKTYARSTRGLTFNDMVHLREGEPIIFIKEPMQAWVVAKVFKQSGEVWILNEQTRRQRAVKYYELRHHPARETAPNV